MKLFLSSLIALLSFRSAMAIDRWNWEKSVETTARNNPELQASKNSSEAAKYDVRGAYGGFFPEISGTLSYNKGTNTDNSRYQASLTAREDIFSGFLDKGKVDRASANYQIALAKLEDTKARLSYELKAAFAGLKFAQDSRAFFQETVNRRHSNLQMVELRFQSGRENKGSVLLSKAYLEQAKLDLIQAENGILDSSEALARLLALPKGEELEVEGAVATGQPPEKVNLEDLVLQTPSYRQSVQEEKAADAAISLAQANFFPTLSLSGTTTDTGPDFFPKNNRWAAALTLTIPFFNGGKDYYAAKGAHELYRAAALTRENALRDGKAKLRAALSNFREAAQKLSVDRAFSEAANLRARIGREKYNNGLLTFEDWDIIENDLINRRKALLASERDRVISEGAWEQALGKGVFQ
jgi:outer membrane protein TolC